jgi:hypothetical protein
VESHAPVSFNFSIVLCEYISLQGRLRRSTASYLRVSIQKGAFTNGLRDFLINRKKTFHFSLVGNEECAGTSMMPRCRVSTPT